MLDRSHNGYMSMMKSFFLIRIRGQLQTFEDETMVTILYKYMKQIEEIKGKKYHTSEQFLRPMKIPHVRKVLTSNEKYHTSEQFLRPMKNTTRQNSSYVQWKIPHVRTVLTSNEKYHT